MGKIVLVTGAASGIGKATALRLQRAGHVVYASARTVGALSELVAAGCKAVALDVADDASRRAAVAQIVGEAGGIDVLVNNAGYSQSGAIEEVSLSDWQRQFDTNVFGLVALTQLVLPGMRAKGAGHVVNIGSMGGALTFPGGGAYHATKYALEAISDALRFEVASMGIAVVLIQPGLIRTGFAQAVASKLSRPATDSPYAGFTEAVERATHSAYEEGMGVSLGGGPDDVAQVIEHAIATSRPRARYAVTWSATILMALRRWLPDWAWDRFLLRTFPQPLAR